MAVKGRATTTNDRKYATQNTTAAKSGTSTIGARPYSSANASTINTGSTAVGKGATTSTAKNTATSSAVGKGGYTTATPAMNQAPSTVGKSTVTPTPTMNISLDTASKAEQPNPTMNTPYVQTTVGKGEYVTASPEKNDITNPTLDDYLTPGYNAALTLAGGANNNPAYANMAPHERTGLWMSVLGAAPGLAGANTNQIQTLLDAVAAGQAGKGQRRLSQIEMNNGLDELGKEEKSLAERPYSNPNYGYENLGFSDTRMQGLDELGKYDYGQSPVNSLLDALTAGPVDSDIRPYSTPNADYLASGGNGLLGYGADASASASASGGGNGGGGTRTSGAYLDNGYIDISALYDLLNQRLGEYDTNYNNLLANLNDTYANALNALGLNYADTESLLNSQLANSRNELEEARKRQLQEAYISRMMGEKNLADQLAAYGLSGGATESVLADMRNNYANNRNTVEQNVQNSLRDLLLNYLTNLSNARQRYNENLYNAENSRVNALNDAANYRSQQRAGAYEDLYNTLANLTMKGINYGS